MKIKIRNGIIYGEEDVILGTIADGVSGYVEKSIEAGSEALPAIMDFIDQVNSGKLKPRSATKKFEEILSKYEITNE